MEFELRMDCSNFGSFPKIICSVLLGVASQKRPMPVTEVRG